MGEVIPFRPKNVTPKVEKQPRLSMWERVKGSMRNRVMEPIGGLFGNIVRDNAKATYNAVTGAAGAVGQSVLRLVEAPLEPFQQFFGAGLTELFKGRVLDVSARTTNGFAAGAVQVRRSFTELGRSFQEIGSGISQVVDNTIFGATRIIVGGMFGKRATDDLYLHQPFPPAFNTPWTVAAHDSLDFEGANNYNHFLQDRQAYRSGFTNGMYNAHYDPSGTPQALPKNVIQFPGAANTAPTTEEKVAA